VKDVWVDLFLCDVGRFISLPVGSLRPLPDCYCQLPRLAYRLHLDGVIPAGGKEWSKSAQEMLASILLQQEVEVEVLGPPSTDIAHQLPSHPATICLVKRYASDPVAPSVTVKVDVATSLLEAGMALPEEVFALLFGEEDEVQEIESGSTLRAG